MTTAVEAEADGNSTPSGGESWSWLLRYFMSLGKVDEVPGTRLLSAGLAAAATSLPLGLLNFFNAGAIIDPAPLYRISVFASVIAFVVAVVLGRFVAPHIAGTLVGALGYGFFSLSWIGNAPTWILVATWFVVSLAVGCVLLWLIGNARWAVTAASVGVCIAAAVLYGLAPSGQDSISETASGREVPEALAFAADPTDRPNVYLFVLDGFARPQITTTQFAQHGIDFDIEVQLSQLGELGFEQDLEGTANYSSTVFSVPSTLNASYHVQPGESANRGELAAYAQQTIMGDNALVNSLRSVGYEYWHSSSVIWEASSCDSRIADRCLGDPGLSHEILNAVWAETPIRNLIGVDFDGVTDPTIVVADILEARQSAPADTPYFVFSHIISPHQPYRFNADCSPVAERSTTLTFGNAPEHRPLYDAAARCLSDQLVTAMTQLLEADPTAIIFLQADHGSVFEVDFRPDRIWQEEVMVRERMGIFRMTHLPEDCRSDAPAAQSLINTVPLIVGCIAGEEPDLIEARILLDPGGGAVELREASTSLIPAR